MSNRQRITEKVAAAEAKAKEKSKSRNKGEDLRDIGDFEYDKSKAKVLKKALHNINVSLGTLLAAMKELAMIKGSEVTPDGKLGGKGFIMPFKEMKATLNSSISELSDITDTIADELTNPKWGLSKNEVSVIKKEKEKSEETAEEAEEVSEEPPKEEAAPEEEGAAEEESQEEEASISPMDVSDSREIEALNRYKSMLEGPPSMDRTARSLSKNIMANLLRGE